MALNSNLIVGYWKSNKMCYICSANNPTMSEDRIISLETKITEMQESITNILHVMHLFVKAADENFTEIKAKIDTLEAKVDNLDGSTEQNFKEVKWELKKIQDVTQYADIHANFPPTGQA